MQILHIPFRPVKFPPRRERNECGNLTIVDGPQSDGLVGGAGGEVSLIRMELDRLDGEVVPDERAQREEAVRRPKAASSIQRTGNKITGINRRRRRYGQNLRHERRMRKTEMTGREIGREGSGND